MRLLLWLSLFISFHAMSYQTSRTSSSKEIKWNYLNIPVRLANSSQTTTIDASSILDQSLAQWSNASGFKLVRSSTGNNQVRFTNDFSMYGSAVVGLTQVAYSTSGNINSATILLNEQNYIFTNTSGIAYGNHVYLKDVLTHELGHFSGLAHSEVLDSTMFYQTYPGQAELAADDKAGIRNKYDLNYGKISGYIKGGSHIGILGVHVQAISRKTGEAISGFTDQAGYFEIGGLDLGDTYYLYSSKLKNLSSLPSYFATVQTDFCPTAYVPSFFSACGHQNDGLPQGISLTALKKNVDVGEVSINCTLRVNEDYLSEKLQTTFAPQEIFNYSLEPKNEKSFVGFFNLSDLSDSSFSQADKFSINLAGLSSPSGKTLKVRLVSQTFGNPVEYTMIVRKNGFAIAGSPFSRILTPAGTLSLDLVGAAILEADPGTNIFEVEISAKKLSASGVLYSIPDSTHFASTQSMPYLVVASIEAGATPIIDTGATLSDNSSCLDAPFTYAVTNSTAASDETDTGSTKAAAAGATCATIDPPSGPGPGNFFGLVTFGFMLSFLVSIFVKRNKNFLS